MWPRSDEFYIVPPEKAAFIVLMMVLGVTTPVWDERVTIG